MKKLLILILAASVIVLAPFLEKNMSNNGFYKENTKSDTNISDEEVVGSENLTNEEEQNEVEKQNEELKESQKEESKEVEKSEDDYETLNIDDVRIPILMYHSISDADSNNNLLVPVSQFEEQIKWFKEAGFTPMLLDDVVEAYTTGYVPKKPIAITFDDGYIDNYTDAYRILRENSMKATFFIITSGTDNDDYYMNSSMLKEMKENGMGIENHTSRHMEFTNISREDKSIIIKEGISDLKEKVGVDSKYLCYPVGRYDDETMEVEKELGIKAAVTTEYGVSSLDDGLYALKRIRIWPMELETFKGIFSDFLE